MSSLISILSVPKPIKKIVNYLTEILKEKQLYDTSLDVQIFNVSSQIYQYNKLMNSFVDEDAIIDNDVRGGGTSRKKNPLLQDLVSISESLRKNLKELGLSLDAKVSAAGDNNPLNNLIQKMNEI